MNYYDPNGKKYTNDGGRIYDDKGYIGKFDNYGNFVTDKKSFHIDSYGNVLDNSSNTSVGKIEGNKFIPTERKETSESNSSVITNAELKAMFGFSWFDLIAFCITIGSVIIGSVFGSAVSALPKEINNSAFIIVLSANILFIFLLLKLKKLIKVIIYLCEEKNFSFSNMLVLFMKEIIIIGIFVIYFIKRSIELDTNLFAFFPEIWIRTIKGLFEYFKNSI